jgi:hypothetical protein
MGGMVVKLQALAASPLHLLVFVVNRSHDVRYRGRDWLLMSTDDGELDPVVLITTLAELPRLLIKKSSEQKDTKGMRCT